MPCKLLKPLAALAVAVLLPGLALAQSDKPISLVMGYSAGGSADFVARIVGAEMAKCLGRQVIIDSVAGASGMLAAQKVLNTPADGNLVYMGGTDTVSMVRLDKGDSSASHVTDTSLPEIAIIDTSIAQTLDQLAQGLVVHPEAMRRNLDLTNGLIASEAVMMQVTQTMGRHQAHHLLYEAAQRAQSDAVPFVTCIIEHPLLAEQAVPRAVLGALDAAAYVGESEAITVETVERVRRQRTAN